MSAIEIIRKKALPVTPSVGRVVVDLYIDDPNHTGTTCAVSFPIDALCAVNDARDYVPPGSTDPGADPSRSRVEGVFDFASGNIVFRVNPSCRVAGGISAEKKCYAPKPEGAGNNVDVSQLGGGEVKVGTTFSESAYSVPAGLCAIHNTFQIRPDAASGDFYLSGHGASFPSIAIIHDGQVLLADQGVHSTSLCAPAAVVGRDYSHSPPQPTPAPTPNPPPTPQSTTPTTPTLGVGTPLPLCVATPCGDGQSIFVDELTFLKDTDPLAPSQTVLYMRVKLKNTTSQTLQVNPAAENWFITDSTQQQVNNGTGAGAPPQCPDTTYDQVSLVPGDSHTFTLCFELPANNDPPKVLTLDSVDIPLTKAGAGVPAP